MPPRSPLSRYPEGNVFDELFNIHSNAGVMANARAGSASQSGE